MSDESVLAAPVSKRSRLRKWGFRLLKTLAAFAVLFAAFHLEENWRGERVYRRALADWKAAGFPTADKFFKNPPPVPDDKNLLAGPFFSAWRVKGGKDEALKPSCTKWNDLRVRAYVKSGDVERLDLAKLFEPDGKKKPLLERVPGKSDAGIIITEAEKDFPGIGHVPEVEATRPELSLGYEWPVPEKMFEAPYASFRVVRGTGAALTLYAEAKLAEGDTSYALAGALATLRYARNPENKTLVGVMTGFVQAGATLMPLLRDGLATRTWSDRNLSDLDAALREYRPVTLLKSAIIGETLAFDAILRVADRDRFKKVFEPGGDDASPYFQVFSLIPSGWILQNGANNLDRRRILMTASCFTDSGIALNDWRKTSLRIDEPMSFDNFLSRLADPAYGKVAAYCTRTQTRLHLARIAVALERHRLKTGAFPASLDALVPAFLEKIPTGAGTGSAVVYSPDHDGGYSLKYPGEDFSDADFSKTPLVGKDVVWILSPPKPVGK